MKNGKKGSELKRNMAIFAEMAKVSEKELSESLDLKKLD
jgi:hypothetical protein